MVASVGLPAVYAVRRFRAMNTDVEIRVADAAHTHLLADAERVFGAMERRFSRFLPESETCALNARLEDTVCVSREMLELVELALDLHRETGGVFDPAVLPELEAAGYDRSFELIGDRTDGPAAVPAPHGRFAEIRVADDASRVTLPPGMRLDFGGIGKGFAVDRAADALRAAGSALVNAGGDMYALGHGWRASIVNPLLDEDAATVSLHDEALATSTTAVRRWRVGGREMHHLIDPRTGAPARSEVISASVIADSATVAEVYAKCALILGVRDGWRLLGGRGLGGLFVLADGSVLVNEAWDTRATAA